MGKKDKEKVADYATTTYDTGELFGSSTTNKDGTTYKPAGWMSETMGTVSSNINPTLNSMLSGDFANDANFKVYQDDFNRNMQQAYDTNVLGDITDRGLMRSSALQASTNSFNNAMQEGLANLYDSYYNRQSSNLSNLLNTSNTLYDYIMGLNSGSQQGTNAVNNYNLGKYRLENAGSGSNSSIGSLIGNMGQIAGTANKLWEYLGGGKESA